MLVLNINYSNIVRGENLNIFVCVGWHWQPRLPSGTALCEHIPVNHFWFSLYWVKNLLSRRDFWFSPLYSLTLFYLFIYSLSPGITLKYLDFDVIFSFHIFDLLDKLLFLSFTIMFFVPGNYQKLSGLRSGLSALVGKVFVVDFWISLSCSLSLGNTKIYSNLYFDDVISGFHIFYSSMSSG